jgi:hypothetical protein
VSATVFSKIKSVSLLRFSVLLFLFAGNLSAQVRRPKIAAREECGPLANQVLKCPEFGFSYQVIFGWVDRTADMQQDESLPDQPSSESSTSPSPTGHPQPASSNSSKTLLAVFERPPAAPGQTINSAVVIATEPLANYHGIKGAADYFSAITELAEQRGFKVVNEPHVFALGTKQLVRGDYSKDRDKLTMWQTSLVMIEKGSIVSFTFIGGSEDEVNDLISDLVFSGTKSNPQIPKDKK